MGTGGEEREGEGERERVGSHHPWVTSPVISHISVTVRCVPILLCG
jgi:hypothetical protein